MSVIMSEARYSVFLTYIRVSLRISLCTFLLCLLICLLLCFIITQFMINFLFGERRSLCFTLLSSVQNARWNPSIRSSQNIISDVSSINTYITICPISTVFMPTARTNAMLFSFPVSWATTICTGITPTAPSPARLRFTVPRMC